jgi:uncharacterized OB-fold protein
MPDAGVSPDANRKLIEEAKRAIASTGLPLLPDAKTADPLYVSSRDLSLKFLIPTSKIKPFFDALKEGRLTATKCVKCGAEYFPPQADCSACRSSEVEYVPLSQEAVLLAYAVINVKPLSFTQYGDYTVAIGRLKEGLNVLAWMEGVDAEKVKVGMKLKLVVGKRKADGILTYWFESA